MTKRSRTLQSEKYLEQKRNKNQKIIGLSSLCGIIFLVVLIMLFRLSFFQIDSIEVSKSEILNTQEIQQKIISILDDNYLFYIPKSNFLFYPKSDIRKELLNLYKNIDSIDIKYVGSSKLMVLIKERESDIIVCEGYHDDNNQDDNCFFADENGYVFSKAPQFSNGVYSRYYIATDLGDSIIGTNFINIDLFNNLQKFTKTVKDSGIDSQGILISSEGNYELYSKNLDDSETVIYFNDRIPLDKTVSNLIAFLNDSKILKKGATSTPVFDSINLRFGNNIFYVTK